LGPGKVAGHQINTVVVGAGRKVTQPSFPLLLRGFFRGRGVGKNEGLGPLKDKRGAELGDMGI
jgi:hypothetical protein